MEDKRKETTKPIITLNRYHSIMCGFWGSVFLGSVLDLAATVTGKDLPKEADIFYGIFGIFLLLFLFTVVRIFVKYEIEGHDELSKTNMLKAHSLILNTFLTIIAVFYFINMLADLRFSIPINKETMVDIWLFFFTGYHLLESGFFVAYEKLSNS